ncbi:MAG: hypothetical protein JO053_09365 [Acidobacteria bacterium]|nr:hypothetical protein [Acidobacteriota bacterium]MBV9216373.1 hypothetical protein [Acidobacteriota bacterium]
MKLRIHGNSIRLRLSQTEVAEFGSAGRVDSSLDFGGGVHLSYSLVADDAVRELAARFEGGDISILIPSRIAEGWVGGDQVGISGEQAAGDAALRILIEKDFTCLVPRSGEEDADTFPHPKALTGHHD